MKGPEGRKPQLEVVRRRLCWGDFQSDFCPPCSLACSTRGSAPVHASVRVFRIAGVKRANMTCTLLHSEAEPIWIKDSRKKRQTDAASDKEVPSSLHSLKLPAISQGGGILSRCTVACARKSRCHT